MRLTREYARAPSNDILKLKIASAHSLSVGTGAIGVTVAAATATALVAALLTGFGSVVPAGTLAVALVG